MKTILKSSDKYPPSFLSVDKPCAVCYNQVDVNGIILRKRSRDLPRSHPGSGGLYWMKFLLPPFLLHAARAVYM
jgi:hypothetical protein